jgi:hypothetical protein
MKDQKNKPRIPRKNSTFLKKNYKSSTIPRLTWYGYKTTKDINECPLITEWLDKCFSIPNDSYIQDRLLQFIFERQN